MRKIRENRPHLSLGEVYEELRGDGGVRPYSPSHLRRLAEHGKIPGIINKEPGEHFRVRQCPKYFRWRRETIERRSHGKNAPRLQIPAAATEVDHVAVSALLESAYRLSADYRQSIAGLPPAKRREFAKAMRPILEDFAKVGCLELYGKV